MHEDSQTEKWLLIDDHRMFADALGIALQSLRPEIRLSTAVSCEEAFTLLRDEPDFHLLLIDLDLPDIHGLSLCELIQARYPDLPLLVCSANTNPEMARRLRRAGARGYLTKDRSPQEILHAAGQIEQGERWVTTEALAGLTGEDNRESLLSSRQLTILRLLKSGHSTQEVAELMHLSNNTIKTHIRLMYDKLDARNRTDCLNIATRMGLI